MKVVILAGGLGTRIVEETDRMPKPMVEIGGRPILWHIMKTYAHYGFREFIICCGYKGYLIKEYFNNYFLHNSDVTFEVSSNEVKINRDSSEDNWSVTLVDTGENTMTGGRIKRVSEYLDKDQAFCFTYGDGLADIDIGAEIKFHKSHGCQATVAAVRPPARFGALDIDGDVVKGFVEKPIGDRGFVNGGFFIIEPQCLDHIEGDFISWEEEPVRKLVELGELRSYRHEGFWQPMDTIRDRNYLQNLWDSGSPPWRVW
ncbi:MAG: glucose-1-phosphate cytidylyltransferase [Acidimicrobiales bacterium]|nr:glucose-1-phosphate cytidylyltransferase [Acidimicrobiales bacterium]